MCINRPIMALMDLMKLSNFLLLRLFVDAEVLVRQPDGATEPNVKRVMTLLALTAVMIIIIISIINSDYDDYY